MVSARAWRQLGWMILPAVLLAGCSGLGKGDKLQSVSIVNPATAKALVPPVLAYQCLRQQLTAYGTFTSGAVGDYTARATWSSSNPAVVRVSNGDPVRDVDPANPANVFQRGVITPVSVGTAKITVEYVGITDSVDVQIKAPDRIVLSTSGIDATEAPANTSIAPGSLLQFRAYARLDGVDSDISNDPHWSITNDPTHAIANVSPTSGLVAAVAAGGPVTVQAEFDACPGLTFNKLTKNVTVSPVATLALSRQFPAGTLLVTTTSEAMSTIATLANGATQDVSTTAAYTTSTPTGSPTILAFLNNVATALIVGTTDVTASFGVDAAKVVSNAVTIGTQAATLNSVAILDADKNKRIEPHGHYDHYHAIGNYTPTAGGANFSQDISRHVLWTSSDATAVFISNTLANTGFALSLSANPGCYSITATLPSNNLITDTTKLGVGVDATPANCTP